MSDKKNPVINHNGKLIDHFGAYGAKKYLELHKKDANPPFIVGQEKVQPIKKKVKSPAEPVENESADVKADESEKEEKPKRKRTRTKTQ